MDGDTNRWIQGFLSNRKQRVVVEGTASEELDVSSGVPQRSVFGPCLFLFYISNIAEKLSSTVRLFADDAMIYMAVKNDNNSWSFRKIWICCVTGKPTERWSSIPTSVKYCRSPGRSLQLYQIHGQQLKHSDCAKYLGVRISNDMRW